MDLAPQAVAVAEPQPALLTAAHLGTTAESWQRVGVAENVSSTQTFLQ